MYAALTASVFKKTISEIMMYFEGSIEAVKQLKDKEQKDHNEFAVGK